MRLISRNPSENNTRRAAKRVKGMTLVECIISLFVFMVCALIMASCGVVVCNLRRDASHLNNKTDAELPISNVRDVTAVNDWTDKDGNTVSAQSNVTATVGKAGVDTNNQPTITGTAYNTYNATKYSTKKAGMDAVNADTTVDADLEFYVITP